MAQLILRERLGYVEAGEDRHRIHDMPLAAIGRLSSTEAFVVIEYLLRTMTAEELARVDMPDLLWHVAYIHLYNYKRTCPTLPPRSSRSVPPKDPFQCSVQCSVFPRLTHA